MLLVPLVIVAVLLGTYLWRLPRAVERLQRSPCVLMGIEHPRLDVNPYDLVLADLEGNPFPFSRLKGRLVVLNFWLTSCGPCLEELPSLLELAHRFVHRPFVLVLAATDPSLKPIHAFIKKNRRLASAPDDVVLLHDPKGRLANRLGTRQFPETYFITPEGGWGGRVVNVRNWTSRASAACVLTRLP